VNVTIPCPCPPKADGTARHEQDTVTLADTLDFRTRVTLRQSIRLAGGEEATEGEMLAALTEAYLLHCITGWTVVDAKGKALSASRANIREVLMGESDIGLVVADAADELYSSRVLIPLLVGVSTSSPGSPTVPSISPKSNGPTPPKPSKPSSTTTTPMAVTGPMLTSPAGASNGSPS
jgi:hypothetical protein